VTLDIFDCVVGNRSGVQDVGKWGLFQIGEVHMMVVLEEDSMREPCGWCFFYVCTRHVGQKVSSRIPHVCPSGGGSTSKNHFFGVFVEPKFNLADETLKSPM
jgi:hypothetical protein